MKIPQWYRNFAALPREYDERAQYIELLVTRDTFSAIVVVVFLTMLALQVPAFASWSHLNWAYLPLVAMATGCIASWVSRLMRGGWNGRVQRWSALWMLLTAPVAFGLYTLLLLLTTHHAFSIDGILGYLAFPLLILVLGLLQRGWRIITKLRHRH